MLIEIHVIKNVSPSNLNRDDSGSPKTCVFGDFIRGRISSQCIKRNMRIDMRQNRLEDEDYGLRTRKLPLKIAQMLEKENYDEETVEKIKVVVSAFGNKDGKSFKDKNLTSQIAFYSEYDIEKIASVIKKEIEDIKNIKMGKDGKPDEKKISSVSKEMQKKLKKVRPITIDIALFGRMTTSDAFLDIDASMQVAHAISTNKIENEFDFYTALDDLLEKGEETGAGMMGDIEFNSSCYYLYSNIDLDQLKSNLMLGDVNESEVVELIKRSIPEIIKSFAYVSPTGKQNSFAAHNPPSLIYIELKDKKIPINYANAFVAPAYSTYKEDLIKNSINKFKNYVENFREKFNDIKIKNSFWFSIDEDNDDLKDIEKCNKMSELIEKVEKGISE
jgi:CRISPR system Cascade subunit CasC